MKALLGMAFFVAGFLLGLGYFYCLWRTVQHLPSAEHPMRLMAASFLIRFMGLMAVFYFLLQVGHYVLLLISLVGFMVARELCKSILGQGRNRLHPLIH